LHCTRPRLRCYLPRCRVYRCHAAFTYCYVLLPFVPAVAHVYGSLLPRFQCVAVALLLRVFDLPLGDPRCVLLRCDFGYRLYGAFRCAPLHDRSFVAALPRITLPLLRTRVAAFTLPYNLPRYCLDFVYVVCRCWICTSLDRLPHFTACMPVRTFVVAIADCRSPRSFTFGLVLHALRYVRFLICRLRIHAFTLQLRLRQAPHAHATCCALHCCGTFGLLPHCGLVTTVMQILIPRVVAFRLRCRYTFHALRCRSAVRVTVGRSFLVVALQICRCAVDRSQITWVRYVAVPSLRLPLRCFVLRVALLPPTGANFAV